MITVRQRMTRYGGSLAVVLAIHAAAIIVALQWPAPKPIELPPETMMVQIAPLPEPAPPPPPTVVTPPTPPTPVEEVPLPKLAEVPKAEIVVPKPPPKPKPKPKPQPPKPEKKPEPPRDEPPAEKPVNTPPAPPAPPTAPKAQKSEPPMPSNSNALPNWQGEVQAKLAKNKEVPDALRRGVEGQVVLHFVIGADGRLLSYEVVGGTGNASLDRAALKMLRKSDPFPPPPKEILKNGSVEITAPFNYSNIKKR